MTGNVSLTINIDHVQSWCSSDEHESTNFRARFLVLWIKSRINATPPIKRYTQRSELGKMKALLAIVLVLCTYAIGSPVSRQRREIYAGYGHGYHGGYPGHGVALAGPLLGHTTSGPVHVSGAVAGPAVVTASVAGPAYVEGYNGPYDGGYYNSPSLAGYGYKASPGYVGYAGHAGYAGYAGYAGHVGHAGHGVVLAGPASHGAVVSGPHAGGSAVAGPHAGSVIIAGPSGKITAHGAGYGGVHAGLHNHGYLCRTDDTRMH
ncbi:fibroin heavy chain-like [Vespula squamosa]|uniref:Fibroin heavy chain-like n=1 Tax=Vespula squamosa TaxID=30214 RepID=A0ABD2A521_VESSQ